MTALARCGTMAACHCTHPARERPDIPRQRPPANSAGTTTARRMLRQWLRPVRAGYLHGAIAVLPRATGEVAGAASGSATGLSCGHGQAFKVARCGHTPCPVTRCRFPWPCSEEQAGQLADFLMACDAVVAPYVAQAPLLVDDASGDVARYRVILNGRRPSGIRQSVAPGHPGACPVSTAALAG